MQPLLIVGLGNPGSKYINNRHNIGFMVLDSLAQELDLKFNEDKNLKSCIVKTSNLILCKPQTFMNLSGEAVLKVKQFFKVNEFLVIHDELDIVEGELRFKYAGGNGGHNGLRSIDNLCGTKYYRLRCGIGRPSEKSMVASYVLSDFDMLPDEMIVQSSSVVQEFISSRDLHRVQAKIKELK